METNTTKTDKKPSWKSWVLGVVLGVGLAVLGATGIIKDETVNNTLIQVGASQTATGAVELNPELSVAFEKTADIIEAAIAARTTDPKELVDLISESLKEYTQTDVRPVVEAAVLYVNQAHAVSENEGVYHSKLQYLAKGFRSGAKLTDPMEEKDDATEE
jgi:hypothetical protein